jgi:threonine dehydratase
MWYNNNVLTSDITLDRFHRAKQVTNQFSIETPLRPITSLGHRYKKLILLKDETGQNGGSFKIRGVSNTVWQAFRQIQHPNTTLITQSTGNHAISTLLCIYKIIEMNPGNQLYNSVIPVIYGSIFIRPSKRKKITEILQQIRALVQDPGRGCLNFTFNSYASAKTARESYIAHHNSIYISHGGSDTIVGHGTMGIELHNQLHDLGIGNETKISIILACGAGGIIGIGACLSLLRGVDNVNIIITQTDDQDAFVKSLVSDRLCYNSVPILDFADGIAVDCPEETALQLAKRCVKVADVVSHKYCVEHLLPQLTHDINTSINKSIPIGGTTTIGFATLAKNILPIQQSEVVILLACEGNI